jgi:nucleotide-binding universal stress UspA family protein
MAGVSSFYARPMYDRILVATDGSETATVAVDRAVAVARSTGARLTVLSAGDEAIAGSVVERELERLSGTGLEIDGAVEGRDPASAIVDAARDGVDLVVVGNVGMTGPRRHFALGSVPNKVSHAISCSLLIVRTS